MGLDISASKFQGVRVIVSQIELDQRKREMLLFDIYASKKLVTAFKRTFVAVFIVVKDVTFSLIRSIACISS